MNPSLRSLTQLIFIALVATAPGASAQTTPTWTADDVTKATGREACGQVVALPKRLPRAYNLTFINPNKGHPFFGVWSQGMKDAAKFYKANFYEADAAGDAAKIPDLFETLLVRKPSAIGTGGQGPDVLDGIGARAQDLNLPFVGIDNGPNEYIPYNYGISDAFAGRLGAENLVKAVQARQQTDWKGKELFFVEFTYKPATACVTRTGAAAKTFKSAMKLDDKHVLMVDPSTGQNAADGMKAILAAHPNAVFAMIPCWDGLGFEPYNAAKDAGREKDVALFTLGGDKPSADLLKTKPVGYVGYLEFQPYCEGWGWVETSLGILTGRTLKPYQTRRITLQADIAKRYADLYGTGK